MFKDLKQTDGPQPSPSASPSLQPCHNHTRFHSHPDFPSVGPVCKDGDRKSKIQFFWRVCSAAPPSHALQLLTLSRRHHGPTFTPPPGPRKTFLPMGKSELALISILAVCHFNMYMFNKICHCLNIHHQQYTMHCYRYTIPAAYA
jgi:hypothetical protein